MKEEDEKNEIFNVITHFIGAIAAVAGLVILIILASIQKDPWKIVSFSIYGTTLFLLYLFSVLYHSFQGKPKNFFRKCDHFAIYLLIAGTYTPFTLGPLRGGWGWSLFGVIWFLALLGIIWDSLDKKESRIVPVIFYVIMGWIITIAFYPLVNLFPISGVLLLVAGGVFYTVGIIFFIPGNKLNHSHGIWHLFVLAGSIIHYFTILCHIKYF